MSSGQTVITEIYTRLLSHYGPRNWWPAESRLEVIIGAILTQAVAWKNVEKAINNLKAKELLTYHRLLQVPEEDLAALIKPALYHRQKARKIKTMLNYLENEFQGNLDLMFETPWLDLRQQLLGLWGIGSETADSILLYAGDKPVFVVDAYTRRIFSRLGMVEENISYGQMQDFMHENVDADVYIYNEFHALLVALGAECCGKKRTQCLICPLNSLCKQYPYLQE